MKRFSLLFLLISGLAPGLRANAQASLSVVGSIPAATPVRYGPAGGVVATNHSPHSSQLPTEAAAPADIATAVGASKSQLLLVLLETIQAQQARLDALQTESETAVRRANRAEAATVAFEQRLRQLEAASSRSGFWR